MTDKPRTQNNEYFYNGNGGEYFLMASLSRRKLDAFKLPVDYGFDVMAMDPLYKEDKKTAGGPYYFQVKTVYLQEKNQITVQTNNKIRRVLTVPVKLKKDTLNLMNADKNKAVIVYVYDNSRRPAGLETEDCPSFYFWINGAFLAENQDCLIPEEDRPDYRICYVNIVYPDNPDTFSDDENSQDTYVTLGPDYLKTNEDGTSSINNPKTKPWKMYHTMKAENGKYFRLSGFFEEAGKGGTDCTTG